MAGAAVDAAAAVDAVGVAEEAILGIAWRVEAEGAGFGGETTFDADLWCQALAYHHGPTSLQYGMVLPMAANSPSKVLTASS